MSTKGNTGGPTKCQCAADYSAAVFIKTVVQATEEANEEESFRASTPRTTFPGTAAGAVFWMMEAQV